MPNLSLFVKFGFQFVVRVKNPSAIQSLPKGARRTPTPPVPPESGTLSLLELIRSQFTISQLSSTMSSFWAAQRFSVICRNVTDYLRLFSPETTRRFRRDAPWRAARLPGDRVGCLDLTFGLRSIFVGFNARTGASSAGASVLKSSIISCKIFMRSRRCAFSLALQVSFPARLCASLYLSPVRAVL